MLTTKIVAIAEALAIDTQIDVAKEASPVIKLAGSQLNGVLPLTPETYAAKLPELSHTNEDYKATMDEVATIMAENMRVTFDQIGTYGKGVTNFIVKLVGESDLYLESTERLGINFLIGMLDLEFVRTDHSFFSSLLYPTRVPNTSLSFTQVSIESLQRLKVTRWDTNRIVEWLSIDNKEINELLMSSNVDLPSALSSLFNPWCMPFHIDETTKTIDFTKPRLNCAEEMFVQYILLGKMMADEVPFEGLLGGSLEEYRTHITLLFSAYSKALICLKEMASDLSSIPVHITEMDTPAVRPFPPIEGAKPYARVRAKATVYFNTAGLDACVEAKTTLSEVAAAYFQRKYVMLEPKAAYEMVADISSAREFIRRCAESVSSAALDSTTAIYARLIAQAVNEFILSREELSTGEAGNIIMGKVKELLNEYNWGGRLSHSRHTKGLALGDAVFDSGFPADFLKAIGCKDAHAILEKTIYLGHTKDNDLDRRAHLHEAVLQHFVNKFLTAS